MPRNRGWFRIYDRLADNPKWLDLSLAEQGLLVNLWLLASAAEEGGRLPGFTAPLIRRRIAPDIDPATLDTMLRHLQALDLLAVEADGTYCIPRWLQHQYEFESRIPANRRVKKDDPGRRDRVAIDQDSVSNPVDMGEPLPSDSEGIVQSSGSDDEGIVQSLRSDSAGIVQRWERSLEESSLEETQKAEEKRAGEGDPPPEGPPTVYAGAVQGRGVRGETNSPPPSETERAILAIWQSIDGYPFHDATDLRHLRALARDFPTLDLLAETRRWATYKLDKPLKKGSNPRLQFRHWCQKALEFEARRRPNGRTEHARDRPDEPRAWSALREALEDPQPPPWGNWFEGLDPPDKEDDS